MSGREPTGTYEWLPPLCTLSDCGGEWHKYLEALYKRFYRDWATEDRPTFEGIRFGLKRHPLSRGKEATFWHLISEGHIEEERTPDLRRCERIEWPRAMIEAIGAVDEDGLPRVLWWRNQRANKARSAEERIIIALPDFSYVVIVTDRGEYLLLWTAYYYEYEHRRQKARCEYENYWKSRGKRGAEMLRTAPGNWDGSRFFFYTW